VVQEFYNTDRAGLRPIIYTQKDGYLTRLSGLDYVKNKSNRRPGDARPTRIFLSTGGYDLIAVWENKLFPYGKLPGGFDLFQATRAS